VVDPRGTAAVLLVGSWARGDAHEASDIDLWVVGGRRRGPYRILERDGHMVCVNYLTAAEARREMRNPGRLDGAVPGWRIARILRDPRGLAARLKAEARRFRWSSLRRERDRYLADQLVAWAEEVAKLLRAMERGERETAAVQRNLLANRMAFLRLLPLERLWDTENGLWERAGSWAGRRFASAQRAALGTDGADWRESCEGALRLYALTARASLGVLRGDKRRIVADICRRSGYPIDDERPKAA
jgi:predicted nucleotidyltransferase